MRLWFLFLFAGLFAAAASSGADVSSEEAWGFFDSRPSRRSWSWAGSIFSDFAP
jgi:hypothetical protein